MLDLRLKLHALAKRRALLIAYLREKLEESDWHEVADAASDIRVIEAEIQAWTKAASEFS